MLFKAPEPVCAAPGPPHGPAGAASNFYSAVGRNGILPQGFDQFYEAAPGPPFAGPQPPPPPAPPQPEGAADKNDPKTAASGGGGCLGNPMDRGAWWATVHGVTGVGHD